MSKKRRTKITDFDFNDPYHADYILDWVAIMQSRLNRKMPLSEADQRKTSELLKIIQENGKYKIPKYRNSRDASWEELICWYVLKTERENDNLLRKEAKEITADVFSISFKTVERYYSRQRKKLEKCINEHGFEEISSGFEYHLNIIKNK